MLYSVLAVGDVVGEAGLAHLERHLRPLQKLKNISFTVVNGENISGVGLTCKQAWRVYDAGADAVTLGNHTFGKMEIGRMLDETPWLLRPANLSGRMPGHGCEIFDLNGLAVPRGEPHRPLHTPVERRKSLYSGGPAAEAGHCGFYPGGFPCGGHQ